ncbi:hypothetical protein AZF37_02400 [endosymbiont 'TC1' of Trimyema compressum]|uniref:UDP-N-acetylmuramate--L-alanine ligase n=1 Tax=endosymbiont 'TC1' of Trimyema compressum TaxID=243899 RepID=UPI0007F0886E|nr:UDP-N-acetylmuramate--L-alanine ligase [endosymbiont 'TC1' of Trimyema compressum]AMP20174.1 hypothetical protein AZF37_02400 [endosymbiont 'TC1' of Trimyema compressum]
MKNIHFIGIGGTGMSGLANICLEKGCHVTGSDLKESDTVKYLENKGAVITIGHNGDLLPKTSEVVVYSTAVKKDNPEIKAANQSGILIWHRSELLKWLTEEKTTYGIAGAHGKTTTTTMVAEIFNKAETHPTVAAGGKLIFHGANGIYDSEGEILIAELDESDGSFLKMKVDSAIITNIDDDHLDYYRTKEKIIEAFKEFIGNVKSNIIINGEDETLRVLVKDKDNVITFGFENCDYTIEDINVQNYRNTGKVYYKGEYIGTINIPLPGVHNLQNALGALVLARLKGIPDEVIFKSLDTFQGVGRRFEVVGQKNGITIVDDYAHHPNEIDALLTGAKSFGYKRVIAVFQPHRYTRTNQLFDEFVAVLKNADLVIVSPIYSAGETPIEGISSEKLVESIGSSGVYKENFSETVQYLIENAMAEDLILTIGAGDICDVGRLSLSAL